MNKSIEAYEIKLIVYFLTVIDVCIGRRPLVGVVLEAADISYRFKEFSIRVNFPMVSDSLPRWSG